MLDRRRFLSVAGLSAVAVAARPMEANAAGGNDVLTASLRGSIDVSELGIRPGALDDQSKAFAKILQQADRKSVV